MKFNATKLCLVFTLFALSGVHNPSFGIFLQESDSTKSEEEGKEKDKDLPLEPERTFNILTNQGSWISLDVSPDGQSIVFDFLGDIYQMPISGGSADTLTSGMAFDGQPRYSPDGKHIVYTSDKGGGEGIWVMDLEELKDRQITSGKADRYQSPEWTPDGKYIVASKAGMRRGALKLWMYHVDGGSGVKLMEKPENRKMTGAAFGPDNRYIWFAQRERDWQYNAIFPQYQLARYDRDTGEPETMSFRYGSGIRPTLSPDGKWLVYGTRHDSETGLVKRNLDTGEEDWLAYPVQHDDQESRGTRDVLPGMSFTPDSQFLIASYGGKIWKLPINGGDAIEIPFEVEAEVEMGPRLDFDYPIEDTPEFIVKQIRDAVPSPDGKKVAFTALDKLYVVDFPDGEPKRLTAHDFTEAQPTWSPDGEWIAFATWNEDEGHLYKARVNSRRPEVVRLTQSAAVYEQPAWSGDGQRIVALKGPAQNYVDATGPRAPGTSAEIIWVSAQGGSETRIDWALDKERPHFSRDHSDRIYFFHPENGLVSIRWDGTDEKHHLKVRGDTPPGYDDPLEASMILMAPEGDQAITQVYRDVYLVTVPYVGGETQTIKVANPDKASFPAKKLSDIGGQFPAWSNDARKVHWSIGNAHVVYDLDDAKAFEEQLKAETEAKEAEGSEDDENGGDEEEEDEEEKKYEPLEKRVEVKAKRDLPEGEVLLSGARVITMKGKEVIESGDVYVKNNRILAVGAKGSLDTPSNVKVIDLTGKTIVPGFVDTHAHMWLSWGIHKKQGFPYYANLAYGVTTTRDPQTATTDVLTWEDMVRTGEMIGPRIYSTGPGMFWQEQVEDLDHARKLVSRYSEYYDTKTIKMYVAGYRQQRQWIIMACKEQEIMPTTEGSLNLKQNLTQIIDGYPGHEHSFPVFPLYEDVVKLVAESKTTYTPTLLVAYGGPWAENYFYTRENPHDDKKLRYFTPHSEIDEKTRRRGQGAGPGPGGWFHDDEHIFDEQAKVVKDVVEAGGFAGVGSHGQLQGLGYHWELWAMQSGGMDNHDALRVATIIGAEAIGLETDLGSIEEGKLADLVILDGNPLDNIRNTNTITHVMKNGRLYVGDTLDEIYPQERKAPSMPWVAKEPVDVPGVEDNE